MKLIIIEGTDNTGKDTLISKIIERYSIVTIIHCGKPYSKKYSSIEQDVLFNAYCDAIINNEFSSSNIIIMNRSHIGEYVYGTLYRNRSKKEVMNMIYDINNKFNSKKDLEVYYIQMICGSAKLLKDNEDGQSLSCGKADKILRESELFKEAYDDMNIENKKLIYVNNGDQFRTREDIFTEAINFINS
jgi:thymidylate kinase